jgi:hypothetical protein
MSPPTTASHAQRSLTQPGLSMTNPLLEDRTLPAFSRIRPSTSSPPSTNCSPTVARWSPTGGEGRRGHLGELRRSASRGRRPPLPRLVAGEPPELRHELRRAARRLQRLPAQAQRLRQRGRPERGPVPRLPARRRAAGLNPPSARCCQHPARPAPGRRRPAGGQEGPLPRDQPVPEPAHQPVRRERARRHQRLAQAHHRRERPRRPARRGQGAGAQAAAKERELWTAGC